MYVNLCNYPATLQPSPAQYGLSVQLNTDNHTVRCYLRPFMDSQPKKPKKWTFIQLGIGIGIPPLFFIFRFTAAAAFLVFLLLCIFFRLHLSHRALRLTFALFLAAVSIPVDVYVPGFHGPLVRSEHSGPRLVSVLYGLGAHRRDGGEFIEGGCVVGLHDTEWRLVWD